MRNSISLWKDELETVIENTEKLVRAKEYYSWLSYDGLRKIISFNLYDHLELEQMIRDEKRNFLIDNILCLCVHGGLHISKARKGKYIPGNAYNQMK